LIILLKESHTWPKEKLCQEIEAYYQKTEREYQYVAIDLALQNRGCLQKQIDVSYKQTFLLLFLGSSEIEVCPFLRSL
jgi:hypothetical protein